MQYIIEGGKKLIGEVSVSGSKNASLPILAARYIERENNKVIQCSQYTWYANDFKSIKIIRLQSKEKGE